MELEIILRSKNVDSDFCMADSNYDFKFSNNHIVIAPRSHPHSRLSSLCLHEFYAIFYVPDPLAMAKTRMSSSLPDLVEHSLGSFEDKEGFEEKAKLFEEVSNRNIFTKNLPLTYSLVSRWERRSVEKTLHIGYAKHFSDTLSDILNILEIDELNEEQKEYIEQIKQYLQFSTTTSSLQYFGDTVVKTKIIPSLKELDGEPKE